MTGLGNMEDFINQLCEHTGIDQSSAERVIDFLREHVSELPSLLSGGNTGGLLGNLSTGTGGLLGAVSGLLIGHPKTSEPIESEESEDDDDDGSKKAN